MTKTATRKGVGKGKAEKAAAVAARSSPIAWCENCMTKRYAVGGHCLACGSKVSA